ncbi:MAG: hypothetical protein MZV70_02100 [Desulfobacterales bacterium]|nr:hypothetical protein [Desulfobacterales bacterium]
MRSGSPVSVHGIARNITDRKKMEEALRKREQELEGKIPEPRRRQYGPPGPAQAPGRGRGRAGRKGHL